jgi:hypothetical protein
VTRRNASSLQTGAFGAISEPSPDRIRCTWVLPTSLATPLVRNEIVAAAGFFRVLVENSPDTIFLIDVETEQCVYVAITNDRPYRRARPIADALAEIERGAGSQFDPSSWRRSCRSPPSSTPPKSDRSFEVEGDETVPQGDDRHSSCCRGSAGCSSTVRSGSSGHATSPNEPVTGGGILRRTLK